MSVVAPPCATRLSGSRAPRVPRSFVSCNTSSNPTSQRGKRKQQGIKQNQSEARAVKPQHSAPVQETLTAPMQVKVEAQLSKLEQAANPWWSTFCGVTNGLWLGQTAAFAPSTGKAEPVAKTSEGKPILDLFTNCAEDRICEGPQDFVLRRTVESEHEADLASAASNATLSDVEEDSVFSDELGMVFFDGGSYSRGPLCLSEERPTETATGPDASHDFATQGNAVEPHRHQGSKEPDEEGTLAAEADVGGSRLPVDAGRVVTLEHCLTWGGEQRKRCRTTLAVSGGGSTGEELDISLLHIRLYHESWQGMLHNLDDATLRANSAVPKATVAKTIVPTDQSVAPSTASAPSDSSSQQGTPVKSDAVNDSEEVQRQHEARIRSGQQASSSTADGQRHQSSSASCQSGPAHTSDATSNASQNAEEVDARASMSTGPCIDSTQLQGSWKVFDLAAVPIDETDIESGITRKAMVYFSQESQQSWLSCAETLDARSHEDEEGEVDGGALWLPGNVILELQMLPMVSRGEVADKVEGISTSITGRGVLLTFSWLVRSGMMISMQREYDASGDLMEVRSRSAVEGSWVGGRM